MQRDARLGHSLTTLLERELALFKNYEVLAREERDALVHFKAETVEEITIRRARVAGELAELREQRAELLSVFPESAKTPLTRLIELHFRPEEKRRLTPLAKKLKEAVLSAQRAGQELGQITNFSLRIVSGTLSILWSATQHITRSYTKQGSVKEAYHSMPNQGILKQA